MIRNGAGQRHAIQGTGLDMNGKKPLQEMFSDVPHRYDLINRLFTMGLDQRWRRIAAGECLSGAPSRVLDLCTGTGDLALRLGADAGGKVPVTGVDFSMPMLGVARRKAAREGMDVPFVLGDAGRLPFRDGTFDAVGIAFAFRNLTYRNPGRDRYLAEIIRVLAPGGRFVIVESSRPGSRIMGVLVGLYLKIAVSFFGGILSGQRGAYRYLARSAANFFPPGELADLLRAAGFSVVTWRTFAYGAAALHVAIK